MMTNQAAAGIEGGGMVTTRSHHPGWSGAVMSTGALAPLAIALLPTYLRRLASRTELAREIPAPG